MTSPKMREALQSFLYEFGDKANSATVKKAREAIAADDAARGTMPPPLSDAEVKHIVRTTPGPQGFQAALVRAGWDAAMTAVEASRAAAPQSVEPVAEIHCPEKRKPGGCSLHNLQCGWPTCNTPKPPRDTPPTPTDAEWVADMAMQWSTQIKDQP